MNIRKLFSIALPALTAVLYASPAPAADTLPRWEAGIAVGAATLPHYMGSDERYAFAVPVPFVIYRGDRLSLDRNGLRAELFGNRDVWMDASLGIGLPVRNNNRARTGMPHLYFSLQAGPRLNWRLLEGESSDLTARLPGRGVMDIRGHYLGWVSEPDLRLRHQLNEDLSLRLNAGMLFASRRYNAHYYNVDPAYVTATRPGFRAGAGLHSLSLGGAVFWRLGERTRLFTTVRYRNLSPGVVHASPLVKTPHYLSAAVGISYSFYQSDETAGSATDE